jgi:hypothetical protein
VQNTKGPATVQLNSRKVGFPASGVLDRQLTKIPFLKIWLGSPRSIDPDAVAFRWGLDYDSADRPAEVSPVADYSEQWTRYKRLRNTWLTFFLAELAFYFGPLDRLTWRTFRPVFPTVDPIYFFVGPLFVTFDKEMHEADLAAVGIVAYCLLVAVSSENPISFRRYLFMALFAASALYLLIRVVHWLWLSPIPFWKVVPVP